MWLQAYIDTLSLKEKDSIKYFSSKRWFRFGDGNRLKALKNVVLPLHIGFEKTTISVDVVTAAIPLLFSKSSLIKAKARIDFEDSSIEIMGQVLPLQETTSGHFLLSLKRPLDPNESSVQRILLATKFDGKDLAEQKRMVLKLHKQFCHPPVRRMKKFLNDAGIADNVVLDLVDVVTKDCSTCKKLGKAPSKPAVGFPLAHIFNEVVAMDLKVYSSGIYFLHMIDHATRYSQAVIIHNKKKETIVQGLITNWVQLFGAPGKFLSDNGGEFVNEDLVELAEKFNITIKTTGAEAPWSNGMCERHNGLIALNVKKVVSDCNCALSTALGWALSAKNSLTNVHGFSPNQLVFGRNPNFPCVLQNKPPANSPLCYSKIVEDNLHALRVAREQHIKSEANEKLSRALNRKTRTYSDQVYCSGDSVYFKRMDSSSWKGPATVLGKEGQTYLIKHGGFYARVHPCRMQLADDSGGDAEKMNANPAQSLIEQSSSEQNDLQLLDTDTSNVDDEICETNTGDTESHVGEIHGPVASSDKLPKPGSVVIYKTTSSPEWKVAKIVSRGGKASGRHWHFLNVSPVGEDNVTHVSFRDDVQQWKMRTPDDDSTALPSVEPDVPTTSDHVETSVYFGTHTSKSRFFQAKLDELTKWREMGTYNEVAFDGQNLITTSWVCTEKVKAGTLTCKARLVARGFEEDSSQLTKESPTCAKDSLRIMLMIVASNRWTIHSLDIKSAFLQGMKLKRDVYIKPPPEAKSSGVVWKLNHAVYGLTDASRHWYERVKLELNKLGVIVSKLDPAMFYCIVNGTLKGILVVHVDDFLYAGSNEFLVTIMKKLYEVFIVGSDASRCMKFLGYDIAQTDQGITVSLQDYVDSITPMAVMSGRAKLRDAPLNQDEYSVFRHLLGQINWCASQVRLDIAFDNCYLSNSSADPHMRDLLYANKTVKKLKSNHLQLHYKQLSGLQTVCLLCYGDASFGNLPTGASQGAYIILAVDQNGIANLISWQSRKLRRICNSTLSAEALAAIEAVNAGIFLRQLLIEVTNIKNISLRIITDNKSLTDTVSLLTVLEDKRLRIDIASLRESIQSDMVEGLFWVPSAYNLANPLTKQGASNAYLVDVLEHKLRFDFDSNTFVTMNA